MSEFPILVGTGENTRKIKRRVTQRWNSDVLRKFSLIQVNAVALDA